MKKRIAVLCAIVAATMLCGTVTACSTSTDEHSQSYISAALQSDNVSQNYKVGDIAEFAAENVVIDGETVTLSPVAVVYPDGVAHKYNGQWTIDLAGIYTVRYSGEKGGEIVVAEKSFSVIDSIYSVGKNSVTEYGKIPDDYYQSHISQVDENGSLKDKEGLIVRLSSGEKFRYNRVLNLKNSTTALPLISLYCLPERQERYIDNGEVKTRNLPDASRMHIRFTDVYDESNYMEMFLTSLDEATGMAHTSAVQVGVNGSLSHRSHWAPGAFTRFCMGGRNNNILNVVYDSTSQGLSVLPAVYIDGPLPTFGDLETFPSGWDGFTTGECYLTIDAVGVEANALNFIVYDICGYTLEQQFDSDDIPPELNVNTLGYDEDDLPTARVGQPYRIFPATVNGGSAARMEVWSDYDSFNPVRVPIANGAFVPKTPGRYTIVYSSVDASGNESKKLLNISATGGAAMTFALTGQKAGGVTGRQLKLYDGLTAYDQRGKLTVEITAVNKSTGLPTEVRDGCIVPLDAGNYEITVTCADYVTTAKKSYIVEISPSAAPMLADEPVLPEYVIKNAPYIFPVQNGYIFSSGRAKIADAKLVVYADDDASGTEAGESYTVKASEKLRLVYTLTDPDTNEKAEKTYEIPVIDTNYDGTLDITKYFMPLTGSFETTSETDGFSVKVSEFESGKAELKFINAVQIKNFVLGVCSLKDMSLLSDFTIKLTDVYDENNSIGISFSAMGATDTAVRIVGSSQTVTLPTNFMAGDSGRYLVYYDKTSNAVRLRYASSDTTVRLRAGTRLDGQPFTGFIRDTAKLSFEFNGRSGAPSVRIDSINNQPLGGLEEDLVLPQILMDDDGGAKKTGTVAQVVKATAADVLDPYVRLSVRVTDPDDNVVTSLDGVLLDDIYPDRDYDILLDKEGAYRVRYTVSDNWRTGNYTYVINSERNVLPEISIGEYSSTVKVGAEVKLPNVRVIGDAQLSAYMLAPDATEYVELTDGNGNAYTAFTANKAGIYTIIYSARDEAGNFVTRTVRIKAED